MTTHPTFISPVPAMARLADFAGTWDTTGEVISERERTPFTATDSYEWVAAGHFLLHRFEAQMPDGNVSGVEIIGHTPGSGDYTLLSFDSTGSRSAMTASEAGGTWTFTGASARFTGRFDADRNSFSGRWELRPDADSEWQPWMDVRLSRRA